ncbi:MAG: hypothetical protein K6E15_10515 [Prevotella sp.]|nr:hypothetical protein [Prevotella sp.]
MKKILLSAVALFATMTVNAQEVGQITTDDLVNRIGLTTDKEEKDGKMQSIKIDVAAGTMFCESANVTMSAAFDDGYSPESAAAPKIDDANYGTIKIGDLTIDATQGVQGNSNPKDEAGANPALASTVPVGPAAVFQFDVKKNGYLYVFHKASSNKNYMVYENKAPMGYIFTMATDGTKALPKVFGYELKGEGEFNYLPEGTAVAWPEKIYLGEEAEDVKVNGLSVIKFPVFEGCSYWVNAGGSKITSCGYYFDETGDATVTIENGVSEAITILDKGQIPGAEPAPAGPVYSVIGTLVGNWDTDTDMKLVNGLYTATIDNVAAGSYEWKIRQDHAWTINWGDNGDGTGVQDGPNFKAELPANSSITITFDPATAAINAYVVGGAIEPQPAGGVIWEGDGSAGAVSWNGTYRFALEGHDGASECIAEIPQATWDKMMTETFYVDLEAATPQVRITNGWWDVEWVGGDIQPGNELLTDNGDGTFTLKVELANQPDLVATLLDKHLLFTGANYTPIKIYFAGGETAINSVKKAANADDAIYNVAGQKVNASYKGLVIKNGKKYIQK